MRIALCFIVVESLPNELLWRLWLLEEEALPGVKVDVFIHCKEYDPRPNTTRPNRVKLSDWMRDRLVQDFHLRPEWASLQLTKVMTCMMTEVSTYPLIYAIILTLSILHSYLGT